MASKQPPLAVIAAVSSAVTAALPQQLATLYAEQPERVPVFAAMCGGADEHTHRIRSSGGGLLAAAEHVLQRGGEVMISFAPGRPGGHRQVPEEFRLALAYTKFEERAVQMWQVLHKVFGDGGKVGCASGALPSCSGGVIAGSDGGAAAAGGGTPPLSPSGLGPKPKPFRVLSLGGGPGNDAVGAIAFLLERQGKGLLPVVSVEPTQWVAIVAASSAPKLTKAQRKAAAEAGAAAAALGTVRPSSFILPQEFVAELPKTTLPQSASLSGCGLGGVQCDVLDNDCGWHTSVGRIVKHSLEQHCEAQAQCKAAVDWHECDVTKPLPSANSGEWAAAGSAASLVVESYLFSVQPGPGGHELPCCVAFWGGVLDRNPRAWFIFVEGTVSKRLWRSLAEVFGSRNRVLTPPINVMGELPPRVVVRDTTGGGGLARARKPRTYCYFFAAPSTI
eukprot:SAG11_NODE_1347_length_5137_cov_15.361651_1_plen_447_part_00